MISKNNNDNIGCINNTIPLSSGLYFDFDYPKPEQITIEDIAQSLSNLCRFNGHCEFYSVAEHSVHCAEIVKKNNWTKGTIFFTLMHDAAEAYVGDMIKPLKNIMPGFKEIEKKVESVIFNMFEINTAHKEIIKGIDNQMLKVEKKHLFPHDSQEWYGFDTIPDVDIKIQCWTPKEAKKRFLDLFERLY